MARWIALLIAATVLAAEPRKIDVAVRVVDVNGEPVAGVHVNFYPSARHTEWDVVPFGDPSVTAADGSYRTAIAPGMWDISLVGPIVPVEMRKQDINTRTRTLEIRVDRGVPLSGRVRYTDGSADRKRRLGSRSKAARRYRHEDRRHPTRSRRESLRSSEAASCTGSQSFPIFASSGFPTQRPHEKQRMQVKV